MYNINLISTRHSPMGECNVNNLYNVLQYVQPDVIFQELPPSSKSSGSLESKAVYLYRYENMSRNIMVRLVDKEEVPSDLFFNQLKDMFNKFDRLNTENGQIYRFLMDADKRKVMEFGFSYLNSQETENLNDERKSAIYTCINDLGNGSFLELYDKLSNIVVERDNEMIQNIYEYANSNSFINAVFLVGSAHRNNIIKTALDYNETSEIKLNWRFDF